MTKVAAFSVYGFKILNALKNCYSSSKLCSKFYLELVLSLDYSGTPPIVHYEEGYFMQCNPLIGKRLVLTPVGDPDMTHNLASNEVIRFEPALLELDAKKLEVYQCEECAEPFSYEKARNSRCERVGIEAAFPKNNTVITYTIGRDLFPVVRGCSGERGFLWFGDFQTVEVDGLSLPIEGLRSFLRQVYPDLLPEFKDEPIMKCIDGKILAANIPMTTQLLKERQQRELSDIW